MDLGILTEVDDRSEVVVESLERSVSLEELDELERSEEIRVLGSDLDDDLEVLSDVDGEHLLEASEGLLDGESTEVTDEPVGGEEIGVNNDSFDVVEILVVLESLQKRRETKDASDLEDDQTRKKKRNAPSGGVRPSRKGWRS